MLVPAGGPAVLSEALRLLVRPPRRALATAAVAALVLAVPDLGRQLLVRDDPSRWHALLVDVVGVLTAAGVQLAVIGLLTGSGAARSPAAGARTLRTALRRRPRAVLSGFVLAGGVSALLTIPVSVAALGLSQVLGPLRDPPLAALLVAQASDVVATVATAAYWGLLVVLCAQVSPARPAAAGR